MSEERPSYAGDPLAQAERLAYQQGASIERIARTLQISDRTVRDMVIDLLRARRALRRVGRDRPTRGNRA